MDTEFVQILDLLAPKDILKPVVPKIEKRLIIDDGILNSSTHDIYVNGVQEDSQYEAFNLEMLALRYKQGLRLLESKGTLNIGHLAYWKPSSYKNDNPIENVLDDEFQTFWQSDGMQPHELCISFNKRVEISVLSFFFSMIADESYTPRLIKIYVGHSENDYTHYKSLEIRRLNGWIALTFEDNRDSDHLLKCQYIKLVFPVNHENGKDTHLRGVRIYTPSRTAAIDADKWNETYDFKRSIFNEFSLR